MPVRSEGITAVTDRQDPARATDTHAAPAATRAPDWPGRFDVYRDGAFVSQKDPTWCTAAASQMMMSLASGHLESSTRRQAEYYAYGYQQRAYAFSEPGLDPAAWVAILDHFGRLRYRVVAAGSVDEALKTAARQMRVTGRPVGLVVGRHGDHSWVMTGFTATADPARTDVYTVTGIWTLGPNWPKQAYYRRAFDSPPHTYFSIKDMRWIMDRYADKLGPTMWDGRFVAVVPEA